MATAFSQAIGFLRVALCILRILGDVIDADGHLLDRCGHARCRIALRTGAAGNLLTGRSQLLGRRAQRLYIGLHPSQQAAEGFGHGIEVLAGFLQFVAALRVEAGGQVTGRHLAGTVLEDLNAADHRKISAGRQVGDDQDHQRRQRKFHDQHVAGMGLAQFELLFKLRNQRLEHHLVTKVDDLRRQRKILLRRRFEFFAEDVITHQGKDFFGTVSEFTGRGTQRTLQHWRMAHDLGQILVLRAQGLLHLGDCRRNVDTHLRCQFLLGQHTGTTRPGDSHWLEHRRHLADHGIHEIVGIHFRVERQLGVVSDIDHEHQRLVDHLRMAFDVIRRRP